MSNSFNDLFGGDPTTFDRLFGEMFGRGAPRSKPEAPKPSPKKPSNHDRVRVQGVLYQRCIISLEGPVPWGYLDDLAATGQLVQCTSKPGEAFQARYVDTERFRNWSLGYVGSHVRTFYGPAQ